MARPPSPGASAIPSLLFDPADPQPFEEMIQPFALAAERRLVTRLGARPNQRTTANAL